MRQTFVTIVSTLTGTVLLILASRYGFESALLSPIYSLHLQITGAAIVIMAMALIVHRSRLAIGTLGLAIALAVHGIVMQFAYNSKAEQGNGGRPRSIKVMEFNILGENMANGARIADEIMASETDIAIIPEAQPLGPHLDRLRQYYPYSIGCGALTANCDLLMLSRHPLVDAKLRNLSGLRPERLATATALVAGQRVPVMAVHLSKGYYDHYHGLELRRMTQFLRQMPGPAIVAGDFNASSLAPDMQRFLDRSGMRKARWEPSTWPVNSGPAGVAIDHIYVRPPAVLGAIKRIEDPLGSNHHGLIAEIHLPGR